MEQAIHGMPGNAGTQGMDSSMCGDGLLGESIVSHDGTGVEMCNETNGLVTLLSGIRDEPCGEREGGWARHFLLQYQEVFHNLIEFSHVDGGRTESVVGVQANEGEAGTKVDDSECLADGLEEKAVEYTD